MSILISGEVHIVCGNIHYTFPNLVVTTGILFAAERASKLDVSSATGAIMDRIAVGTGTATPVLSDTGLGNEVSRKTVSSVASVEGSTEPYVYLRAVWETTDSIGTITEAGVFSSVSGDMLSRLVFPGITKGSEQLLIEWRIMIRNSE